MFIPDNLYVYAFKGNVDVLNAEMTRIVRLMNIVIENIHMTV